MRYDKGYTGGLYETPWQTPNTREAASFGRPLVETRPYVSLGGPGTGRLFKLRGALASELQEEGPQRTEVDAKYGTTLSFVVNRGTRTQFCKSGDIEIGGHVLNSAKSGRNRGTRTQFCNY